MVKDSLNTTPICPKCLVRMEPSKVTKGLYYCWDCELLLETRSQTRSQSSSR